MAKIESTIPSQTSGGTSIHNDLQGLNDGDYKHLTEVEKIKFDSIEEGAEVNVQVDWNQSDNLQDDFIKNKPLTFPPSSHTHSISDVLNLQTELDNKQNVLGYTPENEVNKQDSLAIDGTGVKYPTVDAINNTGFNLLIGGYDASTNTPVLTDGTGKKGNSYVVNVAGVQNFGSGPITLGVTDVIEHNGSVWYKKIDNNQTPEISTQAEAEAIATVENVTELSDSRVLSERGIFYFFAKYFTKLVDGFSFGNLLGNITVKGDVTLEGNGSVELLVPGTGGTIATQEYVDDAIANELTNNTEIYIKSGVTFPFTSTIITGGVEQIVAEITIPADLVQHGSWFKAFTQNAFSTSAAGNKHLRYRVSATSGVLGDLIATRTTTSTSTNGLPLNREFNILNNKIVCSHVGSASALSNISETTTPKTEIAYTYSNVYYLQLTVQMPTAGESVELFNFYIQGKK